MRGRTCSCSPQGHQPPIIPAPPEDRRHRSSGPALPQEGIAHAPNNTPPPVVKHLRRCCLQVIRDADGRPYRWKLASLAFKGERDPAGVPATWVVGEPVARAIAVLQELQPETEDLLFAVLPYGAAAGPASRSANPALGTSTTSRQINELAGWISDYCRTHDRSDGIPAVNGQPFRLLTRQFRRTLAWFIARQPGGAIAGAIQYRHHSIQMFEGYAGTSAPGPNRCPSRGTALTASTRPTGVGPRRTWTRMSAAECRSGRESGRTPSSGQCAACVMTSHPAGGPSATATSSI